MSEFRKTPNDRCEICLFYIQNPRWPTRGYCRRHAPVFNESMLIRFPEVDGMFWCGDFKLGDSEEIDHVLNTKDAWILKKKNRED